ncbi:iron-sulfur cluster-binding domain-containing protein [Alteromonas sp. KUL49]|nr:iron-sulfur cluster-binding domain-containing protein [Alteromonas sp. KUL49]
MTILKSVFTYFFERIFHHASWQGYWEPLVQVFSTAWRHGFHRGKVISNSAILPGVIRLVIKPDNRWKGFVPGQHVVLTIEHNGRLLSRTFTIASGIQQWEKQGIITLIIKQYEQGAFTPLLSDLKADDWLNLSQAFGEFTLPETTKPIVMVAGGSGITPFLSILDTDFSQQVHLIYYAKSGEHLGVNQLATLMQQRPNFSVDIVTRGPQTNLSEQLSKHDAEVVMVCGPSSMYIEAQAWCQKHKRHISAEHFSVLTASFKGESTNHSVSWNNKQFVLNSQETLLSQLTAKGESVTYGCGMGICHQCQCVKKSGVVRDIRSGNLSSNTQQLIQLCVSQVVSDLELEV